MPKRNLFNILTRAPWWLSVLVAAALFMLVRQFLNDTAAAAATLPFLAIAAYAAWRQSRVPTPEHVGEVLASLRALTWQEFSARMEAAFRRKGYAVATIASGAADFELRKNGRVALAACRRWKVAQTGIEPLRELCQAREAAGAHDCIYVTAGDLSENARQFAAQKEIRLLGGAELVTFLLRAGAAKSVPPALGRRNSA